ncbi:MAG TPA: hypothetical protein VN829_14735, partial [Dongiaceae bacterium]|nr:hypothetical protein [Dongiaceae bacterium]
MSGTENQFSLTRAASKPPARQKTTFLSVSVHLTFAGLLAITTNVPAATLYVSPQAPHAAAPYATWDTAATTIQQAVDSANPGDEIVVTNGTYATGGRAVFGAMTNRVAVDKPLTLRSTNGRAVTIIQGVMAPGGGNGDGAVRCMYLTNGVVLSGFTLTNGATRAAGDADLEQSSGGLWCESTSVMISDCVIAGNSGAGYCGGVYSGTLTNCTIATNDGGG